MQIKKMITVALAIFMASAAQAQNSLQASVAAEKTGTCFTLHIQNAHQKELRLHIKSNQICIVIDTTVRAEIFPMTKSK